MKIKTVKIQGNTYSVELLDGTIFSSVPKVEGNKEYEAVKQWLATGGIPLAEFTDAEIIAQSKQSKLVELEALCETQIISGFASSALGSEHWYKSEQIDQLNLIGVVTGGTDDYFKSGIKDTQGVITWDWLLHTSAQLKQVLNDGKNVKTTLLKKLTMQKAQVNLATTLAEVEAVVW